MAGTSFRNVAERFGTSTTATFRHRDHVSKKLALAKEAANVAHADDLVAEIRTLKTDANRMKAKAERDEDIKTALVAIATQARLIELQGRMLAEIKEKAVDGAALLLASPEWHAIEHRFGEVANAWPDVKPLLCWIADGDGPMPALDARLT